MARPLRVEYPGAFYHVINRGNAGEKIFKSQRQEEVFLNALKKLLNGFRSRFIPKRNIQVAENNDDLNETIQIKQPHPK